MQEFPHHYVVKASAVTDSNVLLESPGVESLDSAGPAEFDPRVGNGRYLGKDRRHQSHRFL